MRLFSSAGYDIIYRQINAPRAARFRVEKQGNECKQVKITRTHGSTPACASDHGIHVDMLCTLHWQLEAVQNNAHTRIISRPPSRLDGFLRVCSFQSYGSKTYA